MVTRQTLTIRQKDELTNRFVEKEVSIRSYEVSIWTLQDSFITVLKWVNLENKGQIQQPKMILDVDGTQEFSFSIPMYLEPGKENPIWYNTTNGNLMISMRKIKVILNKGLKDGSEKVYEFIITKVNERHEQDTLFCDVSCEGLAFHELGKRGYKLSLSAENFYAIYEEWFKNGANPATEPHQTLDYWMQDVCGIEKVPENPVPNKWYYNVQMNWSSIGEASFRQPDRIYEDSYVSSWEVSNNKLVPGGTENAREKERPVEIEESNIYNITQTIAETFQVFCRYDYGYDENYHIISRTITFYNNFIAEQDGYMDLTYPYETSAITREMDGTDLCTKLFVRPADYEYSPSGLVTIMDVDANRSKEDYILNFDYLHKFNIITDEQYASIEPYEAKMRLLNTEIEEAQNKISHFDDILLDVNAKIKTNTDIIANAEKQATTAQEHINGLTNGEDGIITIDANNAKPQIILTDDDGNKYIKIPVTGVISSTIRLYYKKNYGAGDVFSNDFEMTGGTCVPDEYGDVARVIFGPNDITYEDNGSTITASSLWLTCQYSPRTYWEAVKKYWIRIGNAAKDDNESWLVHKKTLFENACNAQQTILDNKLEEKAAAITDFEYMMGPALREGYWQPEEYQDYGDKHLINNSFPSYNDSIEEGLATIFWDEHYFDTYDTKIKYQDSLDPAVGDKEYLIVKLSNSNLDYIRVHYDELSFIYYDAAVAAMQEALNDDTDSLHQQTVRNGLKSCHINSGCRLSWIKENNEIYPALIVEDNKVLQDDQLKFIVKNELHSYLGVVEYDNTTYLPRKDDNAIELTTYNYTISESTLILNNGTRAEVFPRIKIDSLSLKNSSNELKITLGDRVLAEYQDYTILILEDPTTAAGNDVVFKYYITLKPHVFYKASNQTFKMSYSISNAQTYIYLDALQVSKENSQPKVSYTVDLSIYNPIIIHDIYNKLSQIVHINDNALKFENVQGYISRIEMDLDLPWEDTIEVKNYKTKFEDLFSTIVAQTEAMKKNSYGYDIASAAFNNDGTLNTDVLIESINNPNFNITEAFINAGFDGIDIVKNTLKNLFDEAGQILSGAGQGLNDLKSLATSNADILSGLFAGIQDGFANGLDYLVPIELITGDIKNISAIRINKDEGIFMGSNRKITLSSTNAIKTDDGYIADSDIALSGANVELSPERLLLGVTNLNNSQGGVVDITSDQVLLAVGNAVSVLEDSDTNITASTQSGVQIKKDYIGLATGNGTNRSIISLSPNEIHIGATTLNQESGNYIHISKDEFKLGGTADLYINTNNFKLQTNAGATDNQSNSSIGNTVFAIGSNLNGIGATSTAADAETNGTVNFLVNQNGAYIKGAITATSFRLSGSSIISDNNGTTTTYDLATISSDIASIQATSITVSYYCNKSSISDLDSIAETNWKSTTSAAIGSITKPYYLYTRNVTTYSNTQSSTAYSVSYVGEDGSSSITTTEIKYIITNSSDQPRDDAAWQSTYPSSGWNESNQYLWARTIIRINSIESSRSYTVSRYGKDGQKGEPGDDGDYITQIQALYNLCNSSSTVTPALTTSTQIYNDKNANHWTTSVPTYIDNYYYWRAYKYIWHDSDPTVSTPVVDYGITYAANTATVASNTAAQVSSALSPISAYGLIGKDDPDYSDKDSNGWPKWNNTSYALILGNDKQMPMLIGSNGGITIADTNLSNGQLGYGSAVVLQGGGIAMHGSSINFTTTAATGTNVVSLNSSGITIGSSGKLDIGTVNFVIDSSATGNNTMMRLGTSGSPALTYSMTDGLRITGAVTATSFVLSSGATVSGLSYNSLTDKPTIPDPSQFTVNGLGYETNWANTNQNYVTLTSTGGLLIGANNGIIIPSIPDSAVNPYLKINADGIELNGKHIKINGQQEWSRDDIIVMKQTVPANAPWQDTVSHIESYMKGETVTINSVNYKRDSAAHDWVLIRPYYDASVSGSVENFTIQGGNNSSAMLLNTGNNSASLGNGASWYDYTVSGYIQSIDTMSGGQASVKITIKNNSTITNMNDNTDETANDNTQVILVAPIDGGGAGTGISRKFTTILRRNSSNGGAINLFQEGEVVYIKVYYGNVAVQITNLTIKCTCDITDSRVPCTVYYYP